MAKNFRSKHLNKGKGPNEFITDFGNAKAIFGKQKDDDCLHPQLIKMARKSGQLNLSNKCLSKIPQKVFYLNELDGDESKQVTVNLSLASSEEAWWEQSDLTRLFLNSNSLLSLDPLINKLASLQLLDISDNKLKDLPKEIGELKCLTKLNLSHNNLESLPEEIGLLDELKYLALNHNGLCQLPEAISTLYLLETMDISNNSLVEFPAGIGYLQRLSKLVASNNKLAKIPPEIGDMFALKHVDLSRNELSLVPQSISNLSKLEELSLRHNKLTKVPPLKCSALKELYLGVNKIKALEKEQLENFISLRVLDISENGLETLPDEITLLQSLERLDLSNNYISNLPYHMGFLPHLKSMSLEGNPLRLIRRDIVQRGTTHLLKYLASKASEKVNLYPGFSEYVPHEEDANEKPVPDQYQMRNTKTMSYNEKVSHIPEKLFENGRLAQVRVADLSLNLLQTLPEEISQLSGHLKELVLNRNKLTCLPSFIGDFKHLQFIDVQNNHLQDLPQEIGNLSYLREINISFNRFAALPTCLFQLPSIEILFAGDNKIRKIPIEEMMKLERLATLDLHNNDIDFVPPLLGKMTQITTLLLEGNAFRVPRAAILAKGTRALMEYLQSRIVEGPS